MKIDREQGVSKYSSCLYENSASQPGCITEYELTVNAEFLKSELFIQRIFLEESQGLLPEDT